MVGSALLVAHEPATPRQTPASRTAVIHTAIRCLLRFHRSGTTPPSAGISVRTHLHILRGLEKRKPQPENQRNLARWVAAFAVIPFNSSGTNPRAWTSVLFSGGRRLRTRPASFSAERPFRLSK